MLFGTNLCLVIYMRNSRQKRKTKKKAKRPPRTNDEDYDYDEPGYHEDYEESWDLEDRDW